MFTFEKSNMALVRLSTNFLWRASANVREVSTDKDSWYKETDKKKNDSIVKMENPFKEEKPKCLLCRLNIEVDYKNVRLLSQFQSRLTGRIYGRHITGLCKEKQKLVETEIAKAQRAGMMGIETKNPNYLEDPPLYDPSNPLRPHPY